MIGFPASTYHARPTPEPLEEAAGADAALRAEIEAIRAELRAYGYLRVAHELRRRENAVHHKRIAGVMRATRLGVHAPPRAVATTDSRHWD